MDIGKMRNKITIQKPTKGIPDGGGGRIPEWENLFTNVWAEIKPNKPYRRSGEGLTARQREEEYYTEIKVRYKAALTKKEAHSYQILLENGKMLEITNIIDYEQRKKTLWIICKERGL